MSPREAGQAAVPEAAIAPGASSIADLSYRNYDGPLKTRFLRWWTVAAAQLRLTWSRWWFVMLAAIPLIRFLMCGFSMYIQSYISTGLTGPMGNYIGEPDGQRYALQFWSALCGETNATLALIITLVAGAGLIAADHRANALLVYFAKPIGKADYLVGKWLSIFLTLFAISAVPAGLLYTFGIISFRDSGFLTGEPWLGPRLLLALLAPALIHSALIIGISAWSKSPRIVGAVYASVYILSGVVVGIVGEIVFRDNPDMKNLIQHCSIRGLINGVTQNIMHVVVPAPLYFTRAMREPDVTDIPHLWPLLTISGAIIVGSIAAAWTKIRAVEVVRG